MADQQIEELTALANVAPGDELIINDVSDTTDDAGGSPKKVTAQTLGIRQNVVTVATTTQVAVNGGYYLCKPATAAGNIVVTLPATPNVGDTVTIEVIEEDTTNQYTVGIDRNGQNVRGSSVVASWLLVANGERLTFRYIDGTYGWTVLDERIKHGARIHANAVQSLPDNAWHPR